MTSIAEKVRLLITLATNAAASEAEARTAAFRACVLIREHGLAVGAATKSAPAPELPTRVRIRSKFAGWCRECGDSFDTGTAVLWAKGQGSIHVDCTRAA